MHSSWHGLCPGGLPHVMKVIRLWKRKNTDEDRWRQYEDSMTGMTEHFVVSKKVFSNIFHPFGMMLPFDYNFTLWLIGPDACRLTLQIKLRLCHETTNVRTCRWILVKALKSSQVKDFKQWFKRIQTYISFYDLLSDMDCNSSSNWYWPNRTRPDFRHL